MPKNDGTVNILLQNGIIQMMSFVITDQNTVTPKVIGNLTYMINDSEKDYHAVAFNADNGKGMVQKDVNPDKLLSILKDIENQQNSADITIILDGTDISGKNIKKDNGRTTGKAISLKDLKEYIENSNNFLEAKNLFQTPQIDNVPATADTFTKKAGVVIGGK